MKYRKLGKTTFQTSEIGLGCWQLGADWGELSETTAEEILETAVENGVNFFDTADVYGSGRSEKIIGKFLKKQRHNIFVATKVGRDSSLYPDNYTKEGVKKCIQDSLTRLNVDSLDLVQLHCIPTKLMEQGEIFEWLRDYTKQGLIKEFGASVESMDEAMVCLKQSDLCSLQIIFNIFRQKPIDKIFQEAKGKQVGIIVRLPLASGLLTGKFSKYSTFAQNDHRSYNRDGALFNVGETFAGLPFEKGVECSDKLLDYLPEGMSLTEMSIRWILDFNAVSVVIPGASRPSQAKQNCLISDLLPLSNRHHSRLTEFYNNYVKAHIRGPY
jgi:aryl-alcohol dehydrogenase-like predicted oxidoreductase